MDPVIKHGDVILYQKCNFINCRNLRENEIVILELKNKLLIKKIFANHNSKITYELGEVTNLSTGEKIQLSNWHYKYSKEGNFRIPQNKYLVLGINLENSQDSRKLGFFSKEEIIGKSLFNY